MARRSRETEGPSRRRKRSAEQPAPRTPPKKKSSPVLTIMVMLAGMVIAWAVLVKEDGSLPSGKIAPSIIGALDQVYLGCTVYWFNQGSHLPCGQEIADKLHDSKKGEIKITVSNGLRQEFTAVGIHEKSPMVFRIDSEGDIFIKAKDCETNIDQIDIAKLDFKLLEAQCKPR